MIKKEILDTEKVGEPPKSEYLIHENSISGGGFSIISRVINYSIQMVSTIVLSRLLTPDDFGIVAMVYSFLAIFLVLQDFGLVDATIQQKNILHGQANNIFWVVVLLSIIVAGIVAILSPFVSFFYDESRLTAITIVFGLIFPLNGISALQTALLKRSLKFKIIGVVEISSSLLSVIVSILMALSGAGYWAIVARPLFWAFFHSLGIWIISDWVPRRPNRDYNISELMKFGTRTSGYFITNYITRNIDKILIGIKKGAMELGFYDKAFQLFLLPLGQITIPLHHVAVSSLTLYKDQPERYIDYYLKGLRLVCFVGFPLCFFLVSMSSDIIYFLLGSQWNRTSGFFSILGISGAMQLILTTSGWLHSSAGRADKWFRWGSFNAILTIIAVSIGIQFGTKGVAVSYSIVLYIITFPALLYAGKEFGLTMRKIFSSIWVYFVSAASTCFIVLHTSKFLLEYSAVWFRIFTFGLFYLLLYLLISIMLNGSISKIQKDIKYIRRAVTLKAKVEKKTEV